MEYTDKATERAKFWTQIEIATYIENCVKCGKTINLEIVEEWNQAVENGKKEDR